MFKYFYLFVLSALFFLFSCKESEEVSFLREVSTKLSTIQSASYIYTKKASFSGDTSKFSALKRRFIKLYAEPSDTVLGASTAIYAADDTLKLRRFYDGKAKGWVYWMDQCVKVDSLKGHPYPFHRLHYPMILRVKDIINYMLSTEDDIAVFYKDLVDSVYFQLKIFNKHVYFRLKPMVLKNEFIPLNEVSQFDIWIRKSDRLPYKMRSRWHHKTLYETVSDMRINTTKKVFFAASEHYPENFKVVRRRKFLRKKRRK
ncbi:MAG: hypothetical protein MI784_01360 [Cytophagales bacterium]|nr:hypothetical protein [Cytophagales bacterium]